MGMTNEHRGTPDSDATKHTVQFFIENDVFLITVINKGIVIIFVILIYY